ncbi:MAG TPA: hypothetical protein VFS11_01370 [Gemmatimonadales bacterium]|nr:hypothetical protein [Gemmatimonadales bacterium]
MGGEQPATMNGSEESESDRCHVLRSAATHGAWGRELVLRLLLGAIIGAVGGFVAYGFQTGAHPLDCDFHQIWIGARALWRGESPYIAVRTVERFPLFYPASALTLGLPFITLSRQLACIAFSAAGTAVLAFALSAQPWRLIALLSVAYLHAVGLSQWSPLAVAAYYLPAAAALWAVKPQLGFPAVLAWPAHWRLQLLVGGMLVAVALVLYPAWPAEWIDALHSSIQVPPLFRPGGILLLATLLRWKRPEARWMMGLAALPQTSLLYETFPLFVVPATRGEMTLLVALSWVALIVKAYVPARHGVAEGAAAHWPILLVCLWLPALAMLLRRPNVAQTSTEGVERRTCTWAGIIPRSCRAIQ